MGLMSFLPPGSLSPVSLMSGGISNCSVHAPPPLAAESPQLCHPTQPAPSQSALSAYHSPLLQRRPSSLSVVLGEYARFQELWKENVYFYIPFIHSMQMINHLRS